ncbi:MAG: hypothetical protein KF859_04145 [Phycisphaeraceae bacterium]|nr:hypothetical protein [Phycisphaeraceae bacterium]
MFTSFTRILVALLIGLWSPMCCCQAALLLSGHRRVSETQPSAPACGESSSKPVSKTCCPKDRPSKPTEPPSQAPEEPETRTTDQTPSHDTCTSCEACQGSFSRTASIEAPEKVERVVCVDALATLLLRSMLADVSQSAAGDRSAAGESPPLTPEGGRQILRMRCALVV